MTKEESRLQETRKGTSNWRKWGPYLSERQWGSVREDYSEGGDAWNFFTHDQARSRAYRWGEDGIAGIADDKQHLCFALALWNGKDPVMFQPERPTLTEDLRNCPRSITSSMCGPTRCLGSRRLCREMFKWHLSVPRTWKKHPGTRPFRFPTSRSLFSGRLLPYRVTRIYRNRFLLFRPTARKF